MAENSQVKRVCSHDIVILSRVAVSECHAFVIKPWLDKAWEAENEARFSIRDSHLEMSPSSCRETGVSE